MHRLIICIFAPSLLRDALIGVTWKSSPPLLYLTDLSSPLDLLGTNPATFSALQYFLRCFPFPYSCSLKRNLTTGISHFTPSPQSSSFSSVPGVTMRKANVQIITWKVMAVGDKARGLLIKVKDGSKSKWRRAVFHPTPIPPKINKAMDPTVQRLCGIYNHCNVNDKYFPQTPSFWGCVLKLYPVRGCIWYCVLQFLVIK